MLPREFTQRGERTPQLVPMTATLAPHVVQGMFVDAPGSPDPRDGLGLLEMVICRGCGLTDWYCIDPERIPIGPQYMTEQVSLDGVAPYR